MGRRRVAITGLGMVSPLAAGLEDFWLSLVSGQGAVCPVAWNSTVPCPVSVAAPALFNGSIEDFELQDAAQIKAVKKSLKVMSREIQLALAASCRALNHAQISVGQFPAERVGISFGSDYIITSVDDVIDGIKSCLRTASNNVLDDTADAPVFDFSRWAENGLPKMPPLWQLKYLPNMPASHIAILNNFHGPSNSITLREASVGACLGESAEIIASGRADVMLVGTTGSRLHPFKLLHAIQQEQLAAAMCRPFDKHRDGTVLGEGAGAVVLEEWEHAEKRAANIFGEVVACSYRSRYILKNLTDNENIRQAVRSVLKDVLQRSGTKPEEVGHINAHGLGAVLADKMEGQAIADVFSNRETPVPVTALKGFFGNLGAGGGMVEFIASVLALHRPALFPALGFTTSDPDCAVEPVKTPDSVSPGASFVKIAFNRQAQASAVLVRKT